MLVLIVQDVAAQLVNGPGLEVGSRSCPPSDSFSRGNSSEHEEADDAIQTTTPQKGPSGVRAGSTSVAVVNQPGSPHPALQVRPRGAVGQERTAAAMTAAAAAEGE